MQSKERFSIECRQTKTKVVKRPIEAEEYTPKLQEKSRQPLVWEHPDDQFATRFRSASDWLGQHVSTFDISMLKRVS